MRKIIVKCKLKNRMEFTEKLFEIGVKFSAVFYLHDRVYVPRGYQRGANFPRLVMRTTMRSVSQPPKYELILKRHIEDSGVDVVDTTEVKDYAEAVNIIHQLGFKEYAEVSRQRQEASMSELLIVLDKVEGLAGYYAKLESPLAKDESAKVMREDLEKTLRVLGQEEMRSQSYVEMKQDVV